MIWNDGSVAGVMLQFEYTRLCLEREESQERDTVESTRISRADDVLPQTSTTTVICLLQFVARFLCFCVKVSTDQRH